MKKIHSDVVSLRAPAIVDAVVKRVSKFTHPLGDWLLRSLSGWNCEVSDTSVEASLYAVIRRRWCESVAARLGVSNPQAGAPGWPSPEAASRMLADAAPVLLVENRWTLVPGLETDEDLDQALSSCVDETLTELELRLGSDTEAWTWGRLHRMVSPHPMASILRAAQHLHPPIDACPGDSDSCGWTVIFSPWRSVTKQSRKLKRVTIRCNGSSCDLRNQLDSYNQSAASFHP